MKSPLKYEARSDPDYPDGAWSIVEVRSNGVTEMASVAIMDVGRCDEDEFFAKLIVAAVNACDKLGLTAEQLEAGVLERLVEAAKKVVAPMPPPTVTWLADGSPRIDARDNTAEFMKLWDDLESALRPFQEPPHEKAE